MGTKTVDIGWALYIQSLQYVQSDRPGCRLGAASPIIIVAYVLLVLSETTMAILTGIKAYKHLRHSQSPWVIQLYKDGLLFYVYLLAISLANVLVPILAPRIFANWLATPQRVLHSVLCNRVLLLILRQRSASNMTTRLPMRPGGSSSRPQTPIFTSFDDDAVSANMTIVGPPSGAFRRSSYSPDPTEQPLRYSVHSLHSQAYSYDPEQPPEER
ncbi:hypothetical protein BDQ12DRAFT_687662 [Crucibulum laeve]|uniref:Uncharacterized protein n=1 Tax=Crucibulum laeve TaxID=68775 RepID=A0A5C3LUR2_9AGAR|nr:hypothetical protein BDQ12DRAFT_687662 [Crucibulum laeve]